MSQQGEFSAPAGATWREGASPGAEGVDHVALLEDVSELMLGMSALGPAQLLAVVSQALARPLALTSVVFFKRVGGQSRSLAWSAADVTASQRLEAREHAWRAAAELVDGGALSLGPSAANVTRAALEDVVLSVSGVIYVECARPLEDEDRWLVEQLLRLLLGLPANDGRPEVDARPEEDRASSPRLLGDHDPLGSRRRVA